MPDCRLAIYLAVILGWTILFTACSQPESGELAAAPTLAATVPPLFTLTPSPMEEPLPPTFTPVTTHSPPTPSSIPPIASRPVDVVSSLPLVSPSPVLTTTLATVPPLRLIPGRPQGYLSRFRLVAFYGVPSGPGLGVLGVPPRETMVQQLRSVAAQYQALGNDRIVLPVFHLVTTIADPVPGDFGNYNHWVREETIAEWIETAGNLDIAVILDIQPGYADLMEEVRRLQRFLYQPHVHLAVDPEFMMRDGAIPGGSIGYITGSQINEVQAFLEEIALETGLNKVLVVHQFDPTMVLNKARIEDHAHVELVIDADGFGSPEAKTDDYRQHAAEPGFEYGGFKLFFDWDVPLMAPAGVMSLDPLPAIIIYQ